MKKLRVGRYRLLARRCEGCGAHYVVVSDKVISETLLNPAMRGESFAYWIPYTSPYGIEPRGELFDVYRFPDYPEE